MSSRRNFIKKTAVFSAGIAMTPGLTFGINQGQDKLKVGLIGVGLRGTNHVNNLVALCVDCHKTKTMQSNL